MYLSAWTHTLSSHKWVIHFNIKCSIGPFSKQLKLVFATNAHKSYIGELSEIWYAMLSEWESMKGELMFIDDSLTHTNGMDEKIERTDEHASERVCIIWKNGEIVYIENGLTQIRIWYRPFIISLIRL